MVIFPLNIIWNTFKKELKIHKLWQSSQSITESNLELLFHVGNFNLFRSKCFIFVTNKYRKLQNEMKPFNWTMMGHLLLVKPFFPLLHGHHGCSKFFYWSLWVKIGTSRVLKAHPVYRAINHFYLCVDHFGDKKNLSKYQVILWALKKKTKQQGTLDLEALWLHNRCNKIK